MIGRKAGRGAGQHVAVMVSGRKIERVLKQVWLLAPMAALACAHQPPPQTSEPAFLTGLFQGLTALFALAASPFLPVRPYAFPNAGFWYDAGFCLGFSLSITLLVLLSIARIGGLITRRH